MALHKNVSVKLHGGTNVTVNAVTATAMAAMRVPAVDDETLEGWFVATDGSDTGAGTIEDPWSLDQAVLGGYPTNSIQPGDTIWLRGGTYTGRYETKLVGTVADPIVFRNYPGERVIIDGNGSFPVGTRVLALNPQDGAMAVQIWGIEITNSTTEREGYNYDQYIGESTIYMPHGKFINCVMHDLAQGVGAYASSLGVEIYGCLAYHNGFWTYQGEPNSMGIIDLANAGAGSVALSGSPHHNGSSTLPVVISHTDPTGANYLVVTAQSSSNSNTYTNMSATYGGNDMTPIVGWNSYDTNVQFRIFGIVTTGDNLAHDVSLTRSSGTGTIRGIAQSFSNVGTVTSKGTQVIQDSFDHSMLSMTVASATDHMLVSGSYMGNTPASVPYSASGSATERDRTSQGGSTICAMATAPGAASVTMGYSWTLVIDGAGHASYLQECIANEGRVQVSAGNPIITISPQVSNGWTSWMTGCYIVVPGAGPSGATLITTIQTVNSLYSCTLATTPSTAVSNGSAYWAFGKTVKDNIWFEGIGDNTVQIYGSSDSGFINSTAEGNVCVNKPLIGGGLTSFPCWDSTYQFNYVWSTKAWPGYHQAHAVGLTFIDNYVHNTIELPQGSAAKDEIVLGSSGHKNTFIGSLVGMPSEAEFRTKYPNNDYYTLGSPPTTNVIVVRPNDYEANRANIVVYNWENLDSVDVDLDGVVANNTAIRIMNAQDYYNDVSWTGTYQTGTPVTLSMLAADHTVAPVHGDPDGIHYDETRHDALLTASPTTFPAFGVFIVRAQSEETWR